MGLFDFVKEIGRKLFNRDAEAADKIKQHVGDQPRDIGPGRCLDGVVSISGQTQRRGNGKSSAHGR